MHQSLRSLRSRKDAVSPVIATILLVGITVVLAATLYIMAFGFGGNTNMPPTASMIKNSVPDGFKWSFTPFSKETTWGNIYFVITEGPNSTAFSNITTAGMTNPAGVKTTSFGSQTLGGLTLFLNATDLAGNGYVNQGDSITITTSGGKFLNTVTYEIDMMDRNTGGLIYGMNFQGD